MYFVLAYIIKLKSHFNKYSWFIICGRWQSQTDSRLRGNFTDQLETSPYFLEDFVIDFFLPFDLRNNFAVCFGFPVCYNGIICFYHILTFYNVWHRDPNILLFQIICKLYNWALNLTPFSKIFQNVFNTKLLIPTVLTDYFMVAFGNAPMLLGI